MHFNTQLERNQSVGTKLMKKKKRINYYMLELGQDELDLLSK